jgi:hypothetical protein
MGEHLLPPPPVRPDHAAEAWADLIDTGEAVLRAGLQTRHGPHEVEARYREWCGRELAEHDRRLERLLAELSRREAARVG